MVSDQFWALCRVSSDENFPLEEPDVYAFRDHVLAMLRVASSAGYRVVLFGDGGDHVLCQNLYYHPKALQGVGWRDWIEEARHFREWSRLGWIRLLLQAYLPLALWNRIVAWAQAIRSICKQPLPWLRASENTTASDGFLPDKLFFHPPGLTPSATIMYENVRSAYDMVGNSALDVTAAYAGVELRAPFWDRRLVDFLLHIPHHLRTWKGVDRVIARESLRGTLPEAVRLRRSKGQFIELVHRGLQEERQHIEALLDASWAEALGFLDATCVRDALQAYWRNGTGRYQDLLRALYLEIWLRNRV
jgi:asparagine synthase (glutamine-hydrolysing)